MLAEHGLIIIPRVLNRECVERQSKNGGALFYVALQVEFDFVAAEDGSKHTACTFGEAMDSSDKATNKAMSAAYKYAAFMTFAIPTEGENDADAVAHEVVPAARVVITESQRTELMNLLEQNNVAVGPFLQKGNISDLTELAAEQFDLAKRWIAQQAAKQAKEA